MTTDYTFPGGGAGMVAGLAIAASKLPGRQAPTLPWLRPQPAIQSCDPRTPIGTVTSDMSLHEDT